MIIQIKPDKITIVTESEHEHKQLVKILLAINYLINKEKGDE